MENYRFCIRLSNWIGTVMPRAATKRLETLKSCCCCAGDLLLAFAHWNSRSPRRKTRASCRKKLGCDARD